MTQEDAILRLQEENRMLRHRIHNLESDLSYHVKKEKQLTVIIKGAISTEFGAFLHLADTVLYNLDRGVTKDQLTGLCREQLHQQLGTMYTTGKLTEEVNRCYIGIIDDMGKDYPAFGPYEKNFFSCLVAGVSLYLIMQTFDLGTTQKASGEKSRLISRIWKLGNRGRVKYMRLLEG